MKFYCSTDKSLLFNNVEPYNFLKQIELFFEYYIK